VREFALLLSLAIALPALAQDKPARKPAAHAKPTAQQIRKFDELEKKEQIRGRSPNSKPPDSKRKAARPPSPK
jgi:hypothetical protein